MRREKVVQEKPQYYGFLDILRTIAIAFVLLRHTIRPFLPDYAPNATVDDTVWEPIKNLMINGWVGVDLFFLLSGFLITQSFMKAGRTNIKKFYFNRAIRIFPAYFFVLILIIINAFPGYSILSENPVKAVIYHVIFMQDYTGPEINTVFWSLGVEVKFYILAPFALMPIWYFIQSQQWMKAYLITLSIILLAPILRYYVYNSQDGVDDYLQFFLMLRSPFHNCIDGLFFGVLLAIIVKHLNPYIMNGSLNIKKRARIIFIILCVVLLILLMSHNFLDKITIYDAVLQPLIISIFFFGITLSGLFFYHSQKVNFIWKWGARLSYSTYLVHWPLIPLCLALPVIFGTASANTSLNGAIFYAIFLWIISISLAYFIYILIERPFLRLKRKINL